MSSSEKLAYFDHAVLLANIEKVGWEYVEHFEAAKGDYWRI